MSDIKKDVNKDTPKENIFKRIFKAIGHFFANVGKGIARFFVNLYFKVIDFFKEFGRRFVDGSVGTKLSHFIFGAGNFYHKQFIKGTIFLLLQVGIILFMVLCPEVNHTPYGY